MINEYTFDGIMKRRFPAIGNSDRWAAAREMLKAHDDEMKAMINKALEEERVKVRLERERDICELTKADVLAMIEESARDGNASSQKILSDYVGLGKKEDGLSVEIVDYKDAPDWYKTKNPMDEE